MVDMDSVSLDPESSERESGITEEITRKATRMTEGEYDGLSIVLCQSLCFGKAKPEAGSEGHAQRAVMPAPRCGPTPNPTLLSRENVTNSF